MDYTFEDFLEEIITERIDQILRKRTSSIEAYQREQEALLKMADDEVKGIMEEFVTNVMSINSEECKLVYREGFLDGLRLGYHAF